MRAPPCRVAREGGAVPPLRPRHTRKTECGAPSPSPWAAGLLFNLVDLSDRRERRAHFRRPPRLNCSRRMTSCPASLIGKKRLSSTIVETEAYEGPHDLASH